MAGSSRKKSSRAQTSTPRPTPRRTTRAASRDREAASQATPSTRSKKRKAESDPEDDSSLEEDDSESDDELPTTRKHLSPAQAARAAREEEELHARVIQAKTKALREMEAEEDENQLSQPDADADNDAQELSPLNASSLGIRPASLSRRPGPVVSEIPDPTADYKEVPQEDVDPGEGRKMEFEVVDASPRPRRAKKQKKKKLTKKPPPARRSSSSDAEEDEDSDDDGQSSDRSRSRNRKRRSSKKRKVDEEGSVKYTRDDFSPRLYRTLQSLKKVVRRYFLTTNLYVYTDGDKTDAYARIWKDWARGDEAPAGESEVFSETAGDRELFEKCCIYVNYTRPYFCLIILNICRTYLSWLGIPGTKSPEEIAELIKWLLDDKLKLPFLHGGLDVEARTFDKKRPYQASWLVPAIHELVWNKRGSLDKWATREILQMQLITAPVFVLFGTCMCHALLEYSTGKRPHFLPFEASTNAYRYFIMLTRINRLRRKVSR